MKICEIRDEYRNINIGFLFYDENGMPLVSMHWEHRFNHMVKRYNDIYKLLT